MAALPATASLVDASYMEESPPVKEDKKEKKGEEKKQAPVDHSSEQFNPLGPDYPDTQKSPDPERSKSPDGPVSVILYMRRIGSGHIHYGIVPLSHPVLPDQHGPGIFQFRHYLQEWATPHRVQGDPYNWAIEIDESKYRVVKIFTDV